MRLELRPWSGILFIVAGLCVWDRCLSFDLYFDLRSLFQLHLVSLGIGEAVGNADLAIKMIRTFNSDLSFFGLTGTGMWIDNLLDSSWKRSTCLGFFRRHKSLPCHPEHTVVLNCADCPAAQSNCLRIFMYLLSVKPCRKRAPSDVPGYQKAVQEWIAKANSGSSITKPDSHDK
jgi:hypothetical protein